MASKACVTMLIRSYAVSRVAALRQIVTLIEIQTSFMLSELRLWSQPPFDEIVVSLHTQI